MDDSQQNPAIPEDETKITLGLLNAVGRDSALTQRSMASELGIALGLANAYLKRCVRKGLIKVTQVPANRYAYYLTPKGFAEKSRLTAEFLSISFNFFRNARSECADAFTMCAAQGWHRIALAGVSDLAEIATLCAVDLPVTLVGIIDPGHGSESFSGLKVVRRIEDFGEGAIDAVVVTNFSSPQAVFDRLIEVFPAQRVITPRLLEISRKPPTLVE
jgi:DNA-binding MarR family transcriptional regulator